MGNCKVNSSLIAFLLLSFTACSTQQCRREKNIPAYPGEQKIIEQKIDSNEDEQKKALVYKYDGSLQCGMGAPISPEVMAEQLEKAGIKVFAHQKKPDGLMHIQVCGSPTGMTNQIEILYSDIKKAHELGFKIWNFN